jgi:hypothetical protein
LGGNLKTKEAHMQISISLPKDKGTAGAENFRHFLKQLELSVHHAQKSLKEMEVMNAELDEPKDIDVTFVIKGFNPHDDEGYEGYADQVEIELYTIE